MAVGVESLASKVVLPIDQSRLFRPLHDSVMSFDHIAQPSRRDLPVTATPTLPPHAADNLGKSHPHRDQVVVPSSTDGEAGASKKRRPSSSQQGRVPGEIRRSTSTPHMRNLALAAAGDLSPTAGKPRNKLGYHRTSVACGHCRRRKIRCLVSQDNPQERRCSNCIRLKKECNFFPVEQSTEHSRSQKERSAGGANPSTPSSPGHSTGLSGERGDEFRQPLSGFPTGNASSKYGMNPNNLEFDPTQGAHLNPTDGLPSPSSSSQPTPYASYPRAIETQQWATPGFLTSSTLSEQSPSSSGYWRPSPSAAPSNYGSDSNMSGARTPATMSTTSNVSYHDGHGWGGQPPMQPPTRSMSHGNIESLHHYANHANLATQHGYRARTSTYPYPTSINTNAVSMQTTSLGEPVAAPLSAPILPSQPYGYQSNWNSYSVQGAEMAMQNPSTAVQWYSEAPHLDHVQEEVAPPMAFQGYYSGA